MPTYEYVCQTCNHRFELRQSFSDEPVNSCPQCGGLVRRVMFPVGIVFKGTGFYSTDYSRGSVGTRRSSESDNGKSSESLDSETKPETNVESKKEKPAPAA